MATDPTGAQPGAGDATPSDPQRPDPHVRAQPSGPQGSRPPAVPPTSAPGAPVTWGLLTVIVAVFAWTALTGGLRSPVLEAGAQINVAVRAGEWWRVLTATFLHGGLTHLAFNGIALYSLGTQLERGVGSGAFAWLYLASGVAGGIAFLIADPGFGVAVGASGAIFGLFGAYVAAAWSARRTAAGRAGLAQIGVLLGLNAALPLLFPEIAWQAHLGGLVVGLAIGLVWQALRRRPIARRVVSPATVAAAFSVVLLASLLWYT